MNLVLVTNLIAFVALKVVAVAADPPDVGSLNNATLLKSFAADTSEPDPDSTPSNDVFNMTKNPPNSLIAFLP